MTAPWLVLVLAGCFAHRHSTAPVAVDALVFPDAGQQAASDAFWTAFGDPELDAAVSSALADNFDVRAARARLDAAAAVVRGSRGAWSPDVSAFADAEVDIGDAASAELGVQASYELDLWGRIASQVRADAHRRDALGAGLQTARIALAAEVVSTWLAIAATQEQLALIDHQVRANEQMAEVMQARFLNGVVRQADALRQERLVEQTRAEQIAREEDLAVLRHQLAVLLGQPPGADLPALPATLPALPPLPDAGVPSDLLRRRPDVRSAELALYAADADVAVAVTNQYPRISLGATFSTDLPADPAFQTWVLNLAGQLLAPVFSGGQRRAEVRRTRAVVDERLAQYGAALLDALRDVHDALARNQLQARAVASIDRQVDLAERTAEGLRVQYIGGLDVGYLDVLTAQTTAQQLRRQQITERQRQLQLRVDLFRSLAGSLTDQPTESPDGG